MKKPPFFIAALLILFLNSCANAQEPNIETDPIEKPEISEGLEIKVLSYNVHHCNPPSKPNLIDVVGIAQVIMDSKADLVGLQEIDVNNERSGMNLDQAAKLAELTDMELYFSKGIDYLQSIYQKGSNSDLVTRI